MSTRDYVYDPAETPFQPGAKSYHANNALCLACASSLTYEDSSTIESVVRQWGFDRCRFIQKNGTQAFICGNDDLVLLLFRGTDGFRREDWLTNIMIDLVLGSTGKAHKGFLEALTGVWPRIQDTLSEYRSAQPLWIGGHSLGGALAQLAGARLQLQARIPVQGGVHFWSAPGGRLQFCYGA